MFPALYLGVNDHITNQGIFMSHPTIEKRPTKECGHIVIQFPRSMLPSIRWLSSQTQYRIDSVVWHCVKAIQPNGNMPLMASTANPRIDSVTRLLLTLVRGAGSSGDSCRGSEPKLGNLPYATGVFWRTSANIPLLLSHGYHLGVLGKRD